MAITISIGLQKGGVGKTTTTGVVSYILSKKYKVLAVDFDSQGNLTQLLSQRPLARFEDQTVLEAIKEGDPKPYIYPIRDNLDLLPADDYLSSLTNFLYQEYEGARNRALANTLDKIYDDYDFILIDLPPNLGEHTVNGIVASNYVLAIMQSEPFSFDALRRYIETIEFIKEKVRNDLVFLGILATMADTRTVIDETIIDKARKRYGDLVFDTIIKRRSRLKEFSITGIQEDTKQDIEALKPYVSFVKELLLRVSKEESARRVVG